MKKFLALALSAAMIFGATACTSQEETGTTDTTQTEEGTTEEAAADTGEEVLIGGLAPLTGSVAVYGVTCTNGANLAFEEINAAGGILGGRQIKYEVLDEKGDETEAVNAYNRLSSEGIVALLGDVTSKPTLAVAGEAANENMPMVTATATTADITQMGENIFRVCFLDPTQGQTMARFAAENLGATTAAVLYNTSDDYSDGVAQAFIEEAEALGLTITAVEGHGNDDVDFRTQLTTIAQDSPDVLFVPDYYSQVALIAAQAKDVGLQSTLMGVDGWDGVLATLGEGNTDAVEGAYFCNHYSTEDESEIVQNFITAYTEKYGEAPSSFAALGYDAAYIIAEAIDRAGSTEKEAIVEALKATDHEGVTGQLTFDENGDPIKTVSIIKIENGQYTLDSRI